MQKKKKSLCWKFLHGNSADSQPIFTKEIKIIYPVSKPWLLICKKNDYKVLHHGI